LLVLSNALDAYKKVKTVGNICLRDKTQSV